MGEINNQVAFDPGLGLHDDGQVTTPAIQEPTSFRFPPGFDLTPLDIIREWPADQSATPSKPRVLTRAERRAASRVDEELRKAAEKAHHTFCVEYTEAILADWAEARFGYEVISWDSLVAEHELTSEGREVSGNIHFIGRGLCAGGYNFTVMVQFDIKNGVAQEMNLKGDTVMKIHFAIADFRAKIQPLVFGFWFDRPDAGFWHPVQYHIEPPRPVIDPLDLEDDPNPIIEYFSDLFEWWRNRNLRAEIDTSNIGSEETPDGVVSGLAYQVAEATKEPSLLAVMADQSST